MVRCQTDSDRARSTHPKWQGAKQTATEQHQLILNGKVPNRQRQSKIKRCGQENHDFDDDFTNRTAKLVKASENGKAAGLEEIPTYAIKNSGPVTMSLLNTCARKHRLPRLWRQARVVALLKPAGKGPIDPEKLHTNFLFVSPLKTIRAPDRAY